MRLTDLRPGVRHGLKTAETIAAAPDVHQALQTIQDRS